MRNLRRTLTALLLATLTAAAAVVAAGVAKAWNEVPDHVDVAAQNVGDAGEYHYLRLDRQGNVELEQVATTFRWLPAQDVRGADGGLHTTNPLALERRYYAPDGTVHNITSTTFVDPQDHDEEVASLSVDGEIKATPLLPTLPALGESVVTRTTEWLSVPDRSNGGLPGDECGPWPMAAGKRLDLHSELRLTVPCLGPLYRSGDLLGVRWFLFQPEVRAVGMQDLDGRSTIVFQGVHVGGGNLWMWLDPDLPYPLQVTQERDGKQHVLRLVRFERGTGGPLAHEDVADPAPAPAAVLADRLPWGMDDAGVDHDFPLSAAWTYARDDPLASGMRDWLAAHPGSYTAEARGRVADYGDLRLHEWKWVLADGTEGRTVGLVRQEDRNAAVGLLPLEGVVPPRVTYRYDNASLHQDAEGIVYPSAADAQEQLPTAASLEAQWRAYSGTDAPLDGWGFRVWCFEDCDHFVHTREWAGQFHFRGQTVGGGPASMVSGTDLDYDVFERTGLVSDEMHPNLGVSRIHRDEAQLTLAGVPLSQQGPASPPQGIVLGGQWMPPGTFGIVTAGAMALLVFLAIRFGGAFVAPLFSRIQAPDLLEHPVRRAVHQAIEANPGIHLKALARTVGRPRGTVEHHVRKLVAADLVTQHELNGYACLFAKGQVDRRAQAAAGALKTEAARKVLAAVVAAPGASGRSVAAQVGLAPTLVSYHAQNLVKAGLLEGQRTGREVRLVPTELGRQATA